MEPADLLVQTLLARTERAKRAAALGPGVKPGPGDLQHSCHHGDRVVRLLLVQADLLDRDGFLSLKVTP